MNKNTIRAITISTATAFSAASALAVKEYRHNFYVRMAEPAGFTDRYLSEHPELICESFSCISSRNTEIRGLLFNQRQSFYLQRTSKGLIVMTHGYNLSIENYLPLIKSFTEGGYMVLAFDGTGVGMSDGAGIYGLPQHILDMRNVLDTVINDPKLHKLPLLLFGHSWGGYAACCVHCLANYPVKGILTLAAFRKSSSSMTPTIIKRYPRIAPILIGSVTLMERILFGQIASITSVDGLRRVRCPVRMYHSMDDSIVSYEESFERVKSELCGRSDTFFTCLQGRNHNLYLNPENDKRQREILKKLKSQLDPLLQKTLTEELWCLMSMTDEKLASEFLTFFDDCISHNSCYDESTVV